MIEQFKWKDWIKRGEVELSCRVIEIGGVKDFEQARISGLAVEDEKVEDDTGKP